MIHLRMNNDISEYNDKQNPADKKLCDVLAGILYKELNYTESKIWHAHPVWFIDGNPIVGYSKQKAGVRLMFWSGADFDEEILQAGSGKFKDASVTYTDVSEINEEDLKRWLKKSEKIQWDYKNIVKRKGILKRLG